jgi:hypothetical protein
LRLRTDCPIDEVMASQITSFRALIELWASGDAMASDIGAGKAAVAKWRQRDSVPAEWWSPILATGIASAAGVKAETLIALAARKPEVAELDEARA